MKRSTLCFPVAVVVIATLLWPDVSVAQRRGVVRHPVAHPLRRTALVVRPGHPIRRALPAEVIIHPTRRAVLVGAPLFFLPALAWTAPLVTLPARERLVWEDAETIERDEGWVDSNFGIDGSGNALFLQIEGKAKLNFAEVTFANGNVQVVDFNEHTHGSGIYELLNFADGRHVKTVRLLSKSESTDTKLSVYLSK